MHWKHSRFETAYIILGNCHTFDEAYRVLCELEEDRVLSIKTAFAESLRAQAKVVTAKTILQDENESKSGKLLAQCNIDEQRARKVVAQPCLDEARRELDFLRMLKEIVNPHRVYSGHPDHIAHQMAQRLEWRYDIHWKSYNHLCSVGHIPYDHMMMIKMHPDSQILMSGVLALRDSMRSDSDRFLTLDKTTILVQVAKDTTERKAITDRDVFEDNNVLSSDHIKRIASDTFEVEGTAEGDDEVQ